MDFGAMFGSGGDGAAWLLEATRRQEERETAEASALKGAVAAHVLVFNKCEQFVCVSCHYL